MDLKERVGDSGPMTSHRRRSRHDGQQDDPRVFISYRRRDSFATALLVHDHLEAIRGRGSVFMDVPDIHAGSDYVDVIEEAIDGCDVLVAVIGESWLNAAAGQRRIDDPKDLVRREIVRAFERPIPVVPLLVGGATMPGADELPTGLRELATRDAITLSDVGFRGGMDRLAEELNRLAPVPPPPPSKARIALAVAVVLALVTIGVIVARPPEKEPVVATPEFPVGSSLRKIQKSGSLRVGTKDDLAGIGLPKTTLSKSPKGFESEIAALLALGIFGGKKADVEDHIHFSVQTADERETVITSDTVDIVAATYSITEERKKTVSFAGPYLMAHQALLVRSENKDVKGAGDLAGRTVCVVRGSTSEANLARHAPSAVAVQEATTFRCAQRLQDKEVEAVTGDDIVLASLERESDGVLKLVNSAFEDGLELIGIGFRKGDTELCAFLNDRLAELYRSGQWKKAYNKHLGGLLPGPTPTPPPLDQSCRKPG
jgi:glutamate transport system substrate-binding protein